MIGPGVTIERKLRLGVTADADGLFRELGAQAIRVLGSRAAAPDASQIERRVARLTQVEVERLDRMTQGRSPEQVLVACAPPRFSPASIGALLGFKSKFARTR
jgi:hypothetical protein